MDSKNNFLEKLKNLVSTMDDDYIIGISNKGILNRSKKDLEKSPSIEYSINEDNIEFKIDDIVCNIGYEIKNYKCSCPSRNICKHVVMSYLYLINHKNEIFGEDSNNNGEEEEIKNDFSKLREYPLEEIKKEIGDKSFGDIIKRISFGVKYELTEGSIIKIDFGEEECVVKLLDDIENSVCSCKSKELCRHKAEALILYKLEKGDITLEDLKAYEKKIKFVDEETIKKASFEIRKSIEEIMITGLARCSQSTLDKINNMAVICHNYDLPNFEKNLRDISKEISLYFNKNASFTKKKLLRKLTNVYTNTFILENTTDLSKLTELIGEFKSSYYEIPIIELYGVSSENWISKSGYEGTTYYFYENKRKKWFTYTSAMPIFYDNTPYNNYYRRTNAYAPWGLNCKIEELSRINFKLVHGKINSQNRLSSSSETKGMVIGKSNLSDLEIQDYLFDNWKTLIDKKLNSYNNESIDIIFLKVKEFGECSFDKINQTLNLPIYDEEKNIINIKVQFSSKTKSMIRVLERLSKKNPPLFLGRVFISEGEITFYPIAYYKDSEVCNLT